MGHPKMRNILRTANYIAKRPNIWGPWCYKWYVYDGFHARLVVVNLGLFGALCKISDISVSVVVSTDVIKQFVNDYGLLVSWFIWGG